MGLKESIVFGLNMMLGQTTLHVVNSMPRHSTKFAKKYFDNKEVEIVEVEVFDGRNLINIFKMLNVKKGYAIEPYIKYSKDIEHGFDGAEDRARKRLKGSNVKWIKKISDNAINDIPMVDFIYIDGLHTYEQVKKDIKNYWNKVKVGGILAGHDITEALHNYGVSRAVMEFSNENNLKVNISPTDWWIIKEAIIKQSFA